MRLSVTCFVALTPMAFAFVGCIPTTIPPVSAFEHNKGPRSTTKVVHARKVAHKVFGVGSSPAKDDKGLKLGPVQAELMWRNGWQWQTNQKRPDRQMKNGLRGGPMVRLGVPFELLDRSVFVGAYASSLRYAMPDPNLKTDPPAEVMRRYDTRQAHEGGLQITITLDP